MKKNKICPLSYSLITLVQQNLGWVKVEPKFRLEKTIVPIYVCVCVF